MQTAQLAEQMQVQVSEMPEPARVEELSEPGPPVPLQPQPAQFDSVKTVKSPVIMRGIYGSRSPGARGRARGKYGGSVRRQARKPEPWEDIGMDEEIWIIEKAEIHVRRKKGDPTQGELRTRAEGVDIPLPLEYTHVAARVSGFISAVDVTQQYHNPYDAKIEAVYVFPLPESSAVTEFVMTVGDRRIRGIIKERKEAEKSYKEAKARGYRAALLTQERPNIFTQKVANIEPGKRIDISISYFSPLKYHDGEYEFVFPMVVGPRYNPPGQIEGIGAVARGKRGISGQTTEVQYLGPNERSGHDVGLAVEIDAGVKIEKVYSRSHVVAMDRINDSKVRVRLKRKGIIPNRDFVLRYKVAGEELKSAMLVHRGEKGNTFGLVLQPPGHLADVPRTPLEMVFVLDCSGSMRGVPISKAKQAAKRCLGNLDKDDTFQVIRFSESASKLGSAPVAATPANIEKALAYIDALRGAGGTRMIEGIKAALDFPHDKSRLRVVSFMTDGYIGNEAQILAAIKQRLGSSRIFSFGVGNSVNRYLIERMASFGKGAVAYVGLDESAGRKVDQFYERIAHPALADVEIDWGDMEVSEVYPRKIPDVFVGRPVIITGRFKGSGRKSVRVTGRVGGKKQSHSIDVNLDDVGIEHTGITGLWARWKIKDFSNGAISNPCDELKEEILRTSKDYGLLCRYTAFLAVDSSEETAGDHGISVNVAVPVPDGVRYATTVQE
ncbi:VIT domain-containing protein [Verrucomicrobiota bacterium]